MSTKLGKITEYELAQTGLVTVLNFLHERLADHRLANDNPNADPLLRGRIAEIKFLFKQLDPKSTLIGADNPKLRK